MTKHQASTAYHRARTEKLWTRVYRQESLIRQGGKCAYCFEPLKATAATADHVRPRSNYGRTTFDNIRAACIDCNKAKGSLPIRTFINMIKYPQPGYGVAFFLAHFRRKLWGRTAKAVENIRALAG
jgi:5-methylcytosine-specific restriction endonuclease McrA